MMVDEKFLHLHNTANMKVVTVTPMTGAWRSSGLL